MGGLNVAQGQTAGRQVEDNNENNGKSLGSIREDREAVVYAHPLHICTLEKSKTQSQHKILTRTKVGEMENIFLDTGL